MVASKLGVVREPLKGSTSTDFFACSFRDCVCSESHLAVGLSVSFAKTLKDGTGELPEALSARQNMTTREFWALCKAMHAHIRHHFGEPGDK